MKDYVLYYENTGEIYISGTCQDEDFDKVDQPGFVKLETKGSYLLNYAFDGELREYTPEQALEKKNRPFHSAYWSNDTFEWISSRSIEDLRSNKIDVMKMAREQCLSYHQATSVGVFNADEKSLANLSQTVLYLQLGDLKSTEYTLADNSRVTLSSEQLRTALCEICESVQKTHSTFSALRKKISEATSIKEIDAISWPN